MNPIKYILILYYPIITYFIILGPLLKYTYKEIRKIERENSLKTKPVKPKSNKYNLDQLVI